MSRTTKQYFYPSNGGYVMTTKTRSYGFFHFLWDVFMVCITAGLWLIWIFVREMRNR